MNRDDIIRMAREAGFELTMWQLSFGYETCGTHEELERFAALVAAAEREAIIDLVAFYGGSVEIEAAIRARGRE